MLARICRVAAGTPLKDANNNTITSGFILLGSSGTFDFYHGAPGVSLPSNATIVAVRWSDLTQTQKDRILECLYTDGTLDARGNLKRFRRKRINVPVGAVRIADNLPPHRWMGDAD